MNLAKRTIHLALFLGTAADSAFFEPIVISAKAYLDVDRGQLVEPATIVSDESVISAVNPTTSRRVRESILPD